jgi:hypothetical protein
LVMNGVFPVEDFNRYVVVSEEESALMCWGMTLHEFVLETLLAILYEEFLILSWDFTWEFFWDVMWNHVYPYLYLYKHKNWKYISIGESTQGIYIGSWLKEAIAKHLHLKKKV